MFENINRIVQKDRTVSSMFKGVLQNNLTGNNVDINQTIIDDYKEIIKTKIKK